MTAAKYTKSLRQRLSRVLFMLCLCAGFANSDFANADSGYKPLFSQSLLNTLDPATRTRFEALEEENRKRWENQHGRTDQAARVAEAQRHQKDAELALRRIAKSRHLEAQLAAEEQRKALRVARRQQECERLAQQIAALRGGGLFYDQDDAGQRIYLSDAQVQQRINTFELRYKEGCTR